MIIKGTRVIINSANSVYNGYYGTVTNIIEARDGGKHKAARAVVRLDVGRRVTYSVKNLKVCTKTNKDYSTKEITKYSTSLMNRLSNATIHTDEKIQCKGHMLFRVAERETTDDNNYNILQVSIYPKDKYPSMKNIVSVYDIIPGLRFLEDVNHHNFMDYDGTIVDVIIDGYVSNLGLAHEGICQGNTLVTYPIFKDICNQHEVYVNWANK